MRRMSLSFLLAALLLIACGGGSTPEKKPVPEAQVQKTCPDSTIHNVATCPGYINRNGQEEGWCCWFCTGGEWYVTTGDGHYYWGYVSGGIAKAEAERLCKALDHDERW